MLLCGGIVSLNLLVQLVNSITRRRLSPLSPVVQVLILKEMTLNVGVGLLVTILMHS